MWCSGFFVMVFLNLQKRYLRLSAQATTAFHHREKGFLIRNNYAERKIQNRALIF